MGITKANYPLYSRIAYVIAALLVRVFMQVFFRMKTTCFADKLPEGRVIFASNHISGWDPPVVGSAIPRQITTMAKKELMSIPVLGRIFHLVHVRPVDRAGYSRGVLDLLRNTLENDDAVFLFPEGTRQRDGKLGRGKIGVGMLSVWTNAPVVPTYVSGTRNVMKAFTFRGRFRVAFGKPVYPPKVDSPAERKQAYQTVTDAVMAEIARLKEIVDNQ